MPDDNPKIASTYAPWAITGPRNLCMSAAASSSCGASASPALADSLADPHRQHRQPRVTPVRNPRHQVTVQTVHMSDLKEPKAALRHYLQVSRDALLWKKDDPSSYPSEDAKSGLRSA